MLGGMSWHSTELYHRAINERVAARLGGLHSARLLVSSVDFADIAALQREDRWDDAGAVLADHARRLQGAGADLLVLATNTMHEVAGAIEAAVSVPFLHIADPTGEALRRDGVRRVGLLGTRFTMTRAFYVDRLRERHGLDVLVPDAAGIADVDRIVFDELCVGVVDDGSRARYREVIADLAACGAEAVILGCTEITLLVSPGDSPVPTYDTTALHARAAADAALA